jgi:serpin B
VNKAVSLLVERGAIVSLPRFEVSSEIRLTPVLKALGMERAFDGTRADFTGFTDEDPLYVSEAITKTFVKVDEVGTEAAAATAIIMEAGCACPSHVVELKLDRTFFFAIRDTKTGAVLFTGRVDDPERATTPTK